MGSIRVQLVGDLQLDVLQCTKSITHILSTLCARSIPIRSATYTKICYPIIGNNMLQILWNYIATSRSSSTRNNVLTTQSTHVDIGNNCEYRLAL